MNRPLRIAIDARGTRGHHGGIETFLQGLCFGLAGLEDGDEEYLLYTGTELVALPRPYVHNELTDILSHFSSSFRSRLGRMMPGGRDLYRRVQAQITHTPKDLRRSNRVLERSHVDLVHFIRQEAFLTSVPSIYHPHDLQHRHLPENFDVRTIAARERQYRAYTDQAALVAVASSWVRDDVIKQLGLPVEKVRIVPLAAILPAYPLPSPVELESLARRASLPPDFVLYPAQTWPHKNHLVLVRAVAHLRRQGVDVPLVFPGRVTAHAARIVREAQGIGVEDLVRFVGFVPDHDLRGLYLLARVVAVPSAFEAGSFPVLEAFDAGVPCVTSDATSLPAQVAGSALVVPVGDDAAMAEALRDVWVNEDLRNRLVQLGADRGRQFSWDRTARLFRALYREICGRMRPEDVDLLAEPAVY